MPHRGRRIEGDEPRDRRIALKFTQTEYDDVAAYAKAHGLTVTRTLVEGFYALKRSEEKK